MPPKFPRRRRNFRDGMRAVLGKYAAAVDTVFRQRPQNARGGQLDGVGLAEQRGGERALHDSLAVGLGFAASRGEIDIGIAYRAVVHHTADQALGGDGE